MEAWSVGERLFLSDHAAWPSKTLADVMGRTADGIEYQKGKLSKERRVWDEFRIKFARNLGVKLKNAESKPVLCTVFVDCKQEMSGTPEQCAEYMGWTMPEFWKAYWRRGQDTDIGFVSISCNKYV